MRPVIPLSSCVLVLLLVAGAAAASEPAAITEGSLCYTDPESGSRAVLPLEHTAVDIAVSGTIAEVEVRQRFANPLSTRLEATYVFPLPDRAAVDAMSIQVGERLIEGEIHRRAEARAIYEQAVREGRLTGLLDQERPNIFTQRVANILPGEAIEVVIHYVEDLHYDHGQWRLVFPAVVGPRYIPGNATGRSGGGWAPDTDRVPDASRITPPVLEPGQRSGHDLEITVDLAPGFVLRELESPSHELLIERQGRRRARIELAALDRIPNKDFVLEWSTAAGAVESTLVAHKQAEPGYLSLILQPPARPTAEQVVPREVVFVLDTSGSMSGEPMAACKQLVRKALRQLRPDDSFRLIRFAGQADQLATEALPVSAANLERALSYLDGMRGGGGTEMLAGVRAALEAPGDPYRLRMILFLTDGYIGNEHEIINRVSEHLGSARIFSFGVGSSVNRFLLDRLAEAGRGVAEYLKPGESPAELVERFYERISDPVFTQLELDWGDLQVEDVEPAELPDLFAGQPLLIHARYRNAGRGTVTLRGWAGTERLELATRVRLPHRETENTAQAQLWARARIARLEMDKLKPGAEAAIITEDITQLALTHRLMSAYTSFVAVDRSGRSADGKLVSVEQPVPMPEGVSHEGVFGTGPHVAKMKVAMAAPPTEAPLRFEVRGSADHAERQRVQPSQTWSALTVPIPDPTPDEPEPLRDADVAAREQIEEATAAAAVARVGTDVPAPQILHQPKPSYSQAALRARIEGVVIVEAEIDETGRVQRATLLRGLPLGLSENALEAVRQWRFQPTIVDGTAVPVMQTFKLHFRMNEAARVHAPEPPQTAPAPAPETPRSSRQGIRAPLAPPEVPLLAVDELSRILFASSLLMLLLASGAWVLKRTLA